MKAIHVDSSDADVLAATCDGGDVDGAADANNDYCDDA